MHRETLERLLTTLDVSLHSFAVLNIGGDARLVFEPMDMVVIHFVLKGEGRLETPREGPQNFRAGYMMVVPAGAPQSLAGHEPIVRNVDAADHSAMLVDGLVRFDAVRDGEEPAAMVICSTLSATYGGSFGLFDGLYGPLVRDMAALPAVRAVFDQLIAERANPDLGTHALTEALMKQCLVLFLRDELRGGLHASPLFASLRDPRLAAAVRDVLLRPAAPRSVADMASIAGMSRSAFAAAFADAFDQAPMDFVQKVRLHHAARLLTGTGLPIKVVAASMGFRSRSHFSRAFSAVYNADPTSYRKQRHNVDNDAPRKSGRGWLTRMTSDSIGGAET